MSMRGTSLRRSTATLQHDFKGLRETGLDACFSANVELSPDYVALCEEFADTALLVRRFRRERGDDFFKSRVASQRAP
jgi:hypothetical protein